MAVLRRGPPRWRGRGRDGVIRAEDRGSMSQGRDHLQGVEENRAESAEAHLLTFAICPNH